MASSLKRKLRLNSPWTQNFISGIGVGCSAGLYVALNLLGAGGGRPDSAQVVQVVNATLCSVWFLSSSFGGSILNKLGPGLTMCIGVQTYAVYVGSLWYYDETGKRDYPYAAGPIIGIGAGCVFITAGYVTTAYPEEKEKGAYATMLMNMQALGSVIGGIIPVIINRDSDTTAGVPRSVYISFITIMVVGGLLCLMLQRPHKLRRDDGSVVAVNPPRGAWEEFKSNLAVFKDAKLLMMLPAFFPSECFLVYSGAVNAYLNNLRVRSLLSFVAVVLQIPAGYGLQWILDHKYWGRRKRGLVGLTVVSAPMIVAWVWEMIRVRDYTRSQPPLDPTDWTEPKFGWIFVLFMLTWISCQLWHNIVYYWIGALTNNPRKLTHYVGIFRGVLGAGEALCFGLDSIQIPFIAEAGGTLLFYAIGISVFYYLGICYMKDTNYDKSEEGAVVPNHVLEERGVITNAYSVSYAAVAASGPKQTPEEAAAPQPVEIEHSESASTASLIDVDTPSVHTVPSDFAEQDVQTSTQQSRIEHEHEEESARAEADLAKKKAAAKAKKADSILTKWFGSLSDGESSALVISNLVGVIGLSGFLGYKAWDLHERGRLGWKNIGLGFGILATVGAVQGVFGRYLQKGKKKQS